jgi:hypothetical protein
MNRARPAEQSAGLSRFLHASRLPEFPPFGLRIQLISYCRGIFALPRFLVSLRVPQYGSA